MAARTLVTLARDGTGAERRQNNLIQAGLAVRGMAHYRSLANRRDGTRTAEEVRSAPALGPGHDPQAANLGSCQTHRAASCRPTVRWTGRWAAPSTISSRSARR